MNISVRIVALVAFALPLGCQNSSQPVTGSRQDVWVPDAAATLAAEYYSGFDQPTTTVISGALQWESAWDRLYKTVSPQPDAPSVDFLTERVILVAAGSRNTGGYGVHIDSLVPGEGTKVFFTLTVPGSRCFVTEAFTQPVHAVRVPIPAMPVTFSASTVAVSCD